MENNSLNYDTGLIRDKHPQKDLFVCDVQDAIIKDIMPEMEHPFYSLSKKPDTSIRRYEHNGNWVEITPSVKGLATIYDKDILVYCISQVMHKLTRGEEVSPRIKINTQDALVFINRSTGGREYAAFSEALDRLHGTRIKTNIVTGDDVVTEAFGLIDSSTIVRENGLDGKLVSCEVTLSKWVFDAIEKKTVLTLHPDYFRLRKPLEKRIYEIARKHCGYKKKWSVSIEILFKKSGSRGSLKEFRRMLRELLEGNYLPDYSMEYSSENDKVIFSSREKMMEINPHKEKFSDTSFPILKEKTYDVARTKAPRMDIYALEDEWRRFWLDSGKPELNNPDGAFVNFCKSRYQAEDANRALAATFNADIG